MINISNPTFIETALRQILDNNSKIDPNSIDFFHQVYFPIAEVELEMKEKTFEDFDTIEKTVLELIGGGFNSCAAVAKLLGVPIQFAEKILNILYGYGHIDSQNQITELGKKSLETDTKITEYVIRQIISVDAMNGCPINIDKSIANNEMVDIELNPNEHIIIPNISETETAEFLKRLNSDENVRAICKKRQIININVTEITDSVLLKTKYASAFMMHLKNADSPIIFTKMYDPSKETMAERFTWQPISVDSSNRYLFEHIPTLTVQSTSATTSIENIYKDILNNNKNNADWARKLFFEDMEDDYKIVSENIELSKDFRNATISLKAFTEINTYTLNMLLSFSKHGVFVYTNHKIHGWVIHITPDSSIPVAALKLIEKQVEANGFSEVLERLTEGDTKSKNVLKVIKEKLP